MEKSVTKNTKPLADDEIRNIYIDKDVWLGKIKSLKGLVDFCVIGSDYGEWMCALGRLDLLRWQIKTVRENGMIPVSISHWASVAIPLFDKEDFAAHWTYANKAWMYMNPESAKSSIQATTKPITAFKILNNLNLPDEIESMISQLKTLGVKSFVVGLESPEHIRSTMPRIMKSLK